MNGRIEDAVAAEYFLMQNRYLTGEKKNPKTKKE